jgi:hypothetical protein
MCVEYFNVFNVCIKSRRLFVICLASMAHFVLALACLHHWKFSKVHIGSRFAQAFQPSICIQFFSCGSTAQFWALTACMKLSVLFRLLDLGESAGLLGRMISSSQGLCVSAPCDCEDGEICGMKGFGSRNLSTRRKPAPTPLCPPQIPLARPEHEPGPPRWEASD